jgi:hypothetical protein
MIYKMVEVLLLIKMGKVYHKFALALENEVKELPSHGLRYSSLLQ